MLDKSYSNQLTNVVVYQQKLEDRIANAGGGVLYIRMQIQYHNKTDLPSRGILRVFV